MNDDLVSRSWLMAQLDGLGDTRLIKRNFVALVTNAPTVDAVEVVRCWECKHHYWVQEPCHGKTTHYCNLPNMSGVEVFKEFFCYYGEQKGR